ncbi:MULTISPECIES: heat shock protein transcriptional repressor HspR [unclassified Pseudoclavibacter]|uniref:heat shock protein transcriptional repressor HspR n=1 Tax=unclassified Pseudoclavibacter TaxID=2615177 RepID=UPI000CE7AEB1|nr:transcriptional regulator [Pseudoclavibacter sp. AY1H1]PPG01725.1 transcriptional regulator [Pseudoclavibacter sp. RFBI5]
MAFPSDLDEDAPIFAIAMAAELANMHPQTLRQYDRMGLVTPRRTAGRVRRYSLRDVAQLREIAVLSNEGVSLEGIARVLELQREVLGLRRRVRALEAELADERLTRLGGRIFAAGERGDVVPLAHGRRTARRTEVVVWRPARIHDAEDEADADADERRPKRTRAKASAPRTRASRAKRPPDA